MTPPSHTRPSPTSKPVIVTNRPMIAADPMIAEAAERAANTKKPIEVAAEESPEDQPLPRTNEKVISPISDTVSAKSTQTDGEDDGKHTKKADTEATFEAALAATQKPAEHEDSEDEVVSDETGLETDTVAHKTAPVLVSEKTRPNSEKKVPGILTHSRLSSLEEESATPAADEAAQEPSTPDDAGTTESASETQESAPEDTEAANLEVLIAKGTYRLPINQVKHRRERISFGISLAVLLLLVCLDVVLDIGIIHIAGIPHTTFFGK